MFISSYQKISKRKAPKSWKGKALPVIWFTASKLPIDEDEIVIVKGGDYEFSAWLDGDKCICSLYTFSPKERSKIVRMVQSTKINFTLFIK